MKTIEDVLRILYPGVPGLLNQQQASNLVLSLIILATEQIDAGALRFLARFFTPQDYNELIEERTIIHLCGYPLCSNSILNGMGSVRKSHTMTAFPWSGNYCSSRCFKASVFYREQLSSEVLVTRRDVAYAPYGTMKYENNILILNEVEHYARQHQVSLAEAVSELVKVQDHPNTQLEDALNQLEISTPTEELNVTEHVPPKKPDV